MLAKGAGLQAGSIPATQRMPVCRPVCLPPRRPARSLISAYATQSAEAPAPAAPSLSTIVPFQRHLIPRVEAPPEAPPMVILPGFGNNTKDYLSPFGDDDDALVAALRRRGFRASVLPLERKDWFKVGRMLLSKAYWSSSCTTAEGYQWYLDRVEAEVARARAENDAEQVVLVGHSAGGWLGRAFLGQHLESLDGGGSGGGCVAALVSLGTPHTPPSASSGAKDMTGGALTWLDARWPGAHFAGQGVRYVAVGGRTVRGDREAHRRTLPGYSHSAYTQVCGDGHGEEGDAVVPLRSALLEGAEHVVIEGVLHSMARVRTFEEPSGERWYGSDDVVDLWLHQLVQQQG